MGMTIKFLKYNPKGFKRLKNRWRKSIGIDSKIRKRKKGLPKMPKIGYGSPIIFKSSNSKGLGASLITRVDYLRFFSLEKSFLNVLISKKLSKKSRKVIYSNMYTNYFWYSLYGCRLK